MFDISHRRSKECGGFWIIVFKYRGDKVSEAILDFVQ